MTQRSERVHVLLGKVIACGAGWGPFAKKPKYATTDIKQGTCVSCRKAILHLKSEAA